jgi:hypothetical protein
MRDTLVTHHGNDEMRFLIEKVKLVTLVTLVTHHVNPTRMRAHTRTWAGVNLYMCHHVSHTRLDNMRPPR